MKISIYTLLIAIALIIFIYSYTMYTSIETYRVVSPYPQIHEVQMIVTPLPGDMDSGYIYINVEVTNNTPYTLYYCNTRPIIFQTKIDDTWQRVPFLDTVGMAGGPLSAWPLPPNYELSYIQELTILYGQLPPGRYRFIGPLFYDVSGWICVNFKKDLIGEFLLY